MEKKRIAILGSTGTIGKQALSVIRDHKDRFEVVLLTANNSSRLLIEQAKEFNPNCVIIGNKDRYREVSEALDPLFINVFAGNESIVDAIATSDNIDIVLTAMVGFSGLEPTVAALRSGKTVAIANKEPLVAAGKLIMQLALKHGSPILPVDSEHSAIFQCLQGEHSPIEHILLTASGGPFLDTPSEKMKEASLSQAIRHPRWNMGPKITIDSASMMNKGFEMIEARWLFGVSPEQIKVIIHPQSIIHSMVSFEDGAVIAQMNYPDMRLPIQYAFTYPERISLDLPRLDFFALQQLTFREPDLQKFPCLTLAQAALKTGGNIPCAMNAANEIAVGAFLKEQISFGKIPELVEKGIEKCHLIKDYTLDDIYETDKEIRQYIETLI